MVKVLVVDDRVSTARLLGVVLRYWGHEVVLSHEAQLALDMLDEYKPDVMFVQMLMPVMDGDEIATQVRRHPQRPKLIGINRSAVRKPVARSKFDLMISKPIRLAEVPTIFSALGITADPQKTATESAVGA